MGRLFRLKKIIVGLVLLVMTVYAYGQYNAENDFNIELSSDGSSVTVVKYTGTGQIVDIPPTIKRLPVTSIGASAFQVNRLTSVTIGNNVTIIGEEAFTNNFDFFYYRQGRRAGTYILRNSSWILQN